MSYSYDYLSRLSSSTFHNYSDAGVISGTNNYNENLTYDLRGNIQTLQRTGFYTNGSTCTYGQIDNLTYSYTSNTNRLHKVLDGTLTAGDAKSRGFNGLLSTVDNSMTYDRNGNLNKNLHKNVSTITYNHLNLPTVITFTTGNTIEFLYDAAGTKLRKTVKVGATVQYIQDYLPGGIEYRQTGTGVKRVESVFHAEGRYYNTNVDASSTISWRKEYNFKDHLGNTRLVFTDRNANGVVDITATASTSDVLQENHYYAFGLAFEGAWLQNDAAARDNAYQYNRKELNSDFGLGWNDYGARWYDAGIGRWNEIDLLADAPEQLDKSSFAYSWNDPVNLNDPDGLCPNCLVGAAFGVIVGAGFELGSQLLNEGKVTSWSAIGGSAAQGAITGAAAGLTMGASLVVTATVAGAANAIGGEVSRNIQNKETTTADVVLDATIGGGLGAAGKVVSNVVKSAADKLSRSMKGKLGEALSEIKYGAQGYKSEGKAIVETGGKTPTGREQVAKYDHDMKNIFTGRRRTVESKYNTSQLSGNQKAAAKNITTPGGLIVHRTTSEGVGKMAGTITTAAGAGVAAKRNTNE